MSAQKHLAERLQRILKNASTPRSVAQLSQQTGANRNSIGLALKRLETAGVAEMTGPTDFLGDQRRATGWRMKRVAPA